MNTVYDELSNLIELLYENKLSFSDNYNLALEELKKKADASSKICQIVDFEKYAQVYFNPVACDYFGTTNEELNRLGFKYVFKYLHPENFSIINTHITYFNDPENYDKIMSHIYYVNTRKGWRWLYNCTKVATFTKEGKAKYLFVKGMDISDILVGKGKFQKLKKNIAFIEDHGSYFEQLTLREKEILKYIVEERTSHDIAELLKISSTTVDTHRNNIIRKLKVKSSVGLVKYAVMFDLV